MTITFFICLFIGPHQPTMYQNGPLNGCPTGSYSAVVLLSEGQQTIRLKRFDCSTGSWPGRFSFVSDSGDDQVLRVNTGKERDCNKPPVRHPAEESWPLIVHRIIKPGYGRLWSYCTVVALVRETPMTSSRFRMAF